MNLTVPFSEFLDVAATFPFVTRVLCLEFHFKTLWEFRESTHPTFFFHHKNRQKPPKKKKGAAWCPQLSVCTPSRFLDSVSGHTNATLPLPSPFHASAFPAPRRCPAYLLLHRSSTEVYQLQNAILVTNSTLFFLRVSRTPYQMINQIDKHDGAVRDCWWCILL